MHSTHPWTINADINQLPNFWLERRAISPPPFKFHKMICSNLWCVFHRGEWYGVLGCKRCAAVFIFISFCSASTNTLPWWFKKVASGFGIPPAGSVCVCVRPSYQQQSFFFLMVLLDLIRNIIFYTSSSCDILLYFCHGRRCVIYCYPCPVVCLQMDGEIWCDNSNTNLWLLSGKSSVNQLFDRVWIC